MIDQHKQSAPGRSGSSASRWLIAVELVLVAAVFVADRNHHIFFSKTPYLLALGWLSLIVRGLRRRDVGLSVPSNWRLLVLIGSMAGLAMELLELFATQPLLVALTGEYPDRSNFHDVVGNASLLLLMISASWLLAGLGEELVWRSYILNRVADWLGQNRLGWSISIGVVSLVFGLAHSNQGLTGIVENVVDGALLALLYLACSRNLTAPIVANGISDTLDSLIIFSGHYPGMHS